jgi:hypothetical protein
LAVAVAFWFVTASLRGSLEVFNNDTGVTTAMDMKTIQFLREHPEHGQARPGSWTRQMLDAAHGEGWCERMLQTDLTVKSPEG